MAWRALLDGDSATRARTLVEAIADEIDRRSIDNPRFATGQAGIAILHAYRARAGCEDGADRAFAALEVALERLDEITGPGLFDGCAGVGLAVHLLGDVCDVDSDVLESFDELVAGALAGDRLASWELADGAIGLGVYGLARRRADLVAAAVGHVVRHAEHAASGVTWRNVTPENPDGYLNLGVPHGIAGAIAFLAEACAAGSGDSDVAGLARDAMRWLRAQERPEQVPRFAMTSGPVVRTYDGILDGWCYGDPSTAMLLVRAGGLLAEPAWIDAGRELARLAARRTRDELARLAIDTSLCHGAISHAHLFNRLGQYFADTQLLATAHHWYERVLASDPIAANREAGLQVGLAGIALGLVSAASDVDPAWDRALLISLPDR